MFATSLLSFAFALSPPPDLDIGWLEGHWCGEADGVPSEELWTGGAHGMAVGLHKDLAADGSASFEFMRIEAYGTRATFFGQPNGDAATPFRSEQVEPKAIVFANAANDYPKRVAYRRVDDATLEAWIDDGDGLKKQAWRWTKCAASPTDR